MFERKSSPSEFTHFRSLTIAWIAALFAALLIVVFSVRTMAIPEQALEKANHMLSEFEGEIVAFGSSQILHSLPHTSTDLEQGSLLGDGRDHLRLSINEVTQEELMVLLKHAVQLKKPLVFIDVTPFYQRSALRDTNILSRTVAPLTSSALALVRQKLFGRSARARLRHKTPAQPNQFAFSEEVASIRRDGQIGISRAKWPDVTKLVAKVKQRGHEIVFIAHPRSAFLSEFYGRKLVAEREQLAIEVADHFGLPMFNPAATWPDHYFSDADHLNNAGRIRYVQELRAWYSSNQ